MNYALPASLSPARLSSLAESRRPLEQSLLTQIEALKGRLDNFTVADAHGETMGEIRNLVLYKQRLHLVIVQPDVHRHWRFVLLSSPLVQRVSLRDRTIFVHTTHADVSYLPEQRSIKRTDISHYANVHASVTIPVSQLPASQTYRNIKAPLVIEYPAMPKVLADTVDASVERSPNLNQENNETYYAPSYPVVTPARPVTVRVGERMP